MSEIIKFEDIKRKKNLTDEDINSLFLGLVNLVKANAIENVANNIKKEYKESNIKLNNAMLEIKLKNEIILDLKKENENLKNKTDILINKINELKKQNTNINNF